MGLIVGTMVGAGGSAVEVGTGVVSGSGFFLCGFDFFGFGSITFILHKYFFLPILAVILVLPFFLAVTFPF